MMKHIFCSTKLIKFSGLFSNAAKNYQSIEAIKSLPVRK